MERLFTYQYYNLKGLPFLFIMRVFDSSTATRLFLLCSTHGDPHYLWDLNQVIRDKCGIGSMADGVKQ